VFGRFGLTRHGFRNLVTQLPVRIDANSSFFQNEFVRAAARLALSKWHSVRAMKSSKHTVSAAFVVPLRQRLTALRQQIYAQPQRR
jgi:hypothetical protein